MAFPARFLGISQFSGNKYFLAALAIFFIPISGLSTDIFIPSLPNIQAYFHSTQSLTQYTISAYLAGIGLMQLFAGGISDSFGRRKPFLIATSLFTLVTLLIPFSTSMHQMIMLRLIQGITVACMVVPMRAVVADLFQGKELQKMVTYMAFGWTIGPIIAPFIGGYLQHYFGWKSCFYFLLGYSIIGSLAIYIYMPETSLHRHEYSIRSILKRYKELLTYRPYLSALLTSSLLYSIVILFMTVMPFLTKEELGFTPIQYGHLALFTGIAWSAGSLSNRFLIHLSVKLREQICISTLIFATLLFLVFSLFMSLSVYTLLIPTLILYIAGGMLMTTYFSQALSMFPESAASANSLMGAAVFLIPSLISSVGTLLKSTSSVPIAIAFVVLIIAVIAVQKLNGERYSDRINELKSSN